jgi:hypothetical protein
MSTLNTNKNSFLSSVQLLKNDFHAFASLGVPKGSMNEKQRKSALPNFISNAIDSVDTATFGIRVIFLNRTNQSASYDVSRVYSIQDTMYPA